MTSFNCLYYFLTKDIFRSWKYGKIFREITLSHWTVRKNVYTSAKSICYSQPTAISHPHLLKKGEVTPGISADIYKNRRQRLMEVIYKSTHINSKSKSAHLIVIPSGSVVIMTEHIPYFFRQNTDFFYLCGFQEPDSVLVIHSLSDESNLDYRCELFIPKQSKDSIQWEGKKMDLQTVSDFLGIDRASYMEDLEKFLELFSKSHRHFTVWYDYFGSPFRLIREKMNDFFAAYSGSMSVESPKRVLHEIRLIKCDAEAELMRKTCKIAAESMKEVMRFSHSMICESHLEAKMDYECCIRGANHLAFPPVVGGADRASTIHYIDNNQIINDGELVLMDAGCEYHGYTSDMTRTWPMNGRFTSAQRELYEVVLSVQEDLIKMCQQKIPLNKLFDFMCIKLGKGLQELGIIPVSVTEKDIAEAGYELCRHHVSHYLGMDVHDTCLISRGIELLPGMVVTVEPGVYIPKNSKCPERYRGLCIRIEDDILITRDGYEILTSDCPKHIDQIEELCKKS
ncbi:xaa-Pro aminopeptidase 3 [Nephila pilipes]|uniref:Xaa-Pro aminopeptidase 3 n=1 Tax=Nephila pilipes TaxID=299642 RepID=A0A8X6U8Y3_NEPPI|nr:xaa-Pro aminopeptidase 3 [Nephila pilipes]